LSWVMYVIFAIGLDIGIKKNRASM